MTPSNNEGKLPADHHNLERDPLTFNVPCISESSDLSMNGVRSHSHAPTHASIDLSYRRKCKSLYDELIARYHFRKCLQLSFRK